MKDFSATLLKELYERIEPLGVPVYSFIPDDISTPYTFIGDISIIQQQNKDKFIFYGFINISYSTGYNIKGSLLTHLTYINNLKNALKIDKNDIIDMGRDHKMIYWTISNEDNMDKIDDKKNLYITNIQMNYEIIEI